MSPKGDLLMIVDEGSWMNVRRFRALRERGVPLAEIARECRCDGRAVNAPHRVALVRAGARFDKCAIVDRDDDQRGGDQLVS